MRRLVATVLLIFLASIVGCTVIGAQYYEITDPASGRKYVTNDWIASKYKFNGALEFHDLCTDKDTVLQSSEAKTISHDEAKMDILEAGAFTGGNSQ